MNDKSKSLVVRFAERFGVDQQKLLDTLKATAFKQRDGSAPTNEQMMTLLVVAEQYNLNPFTKEIYAFPDKQSRGIIPVVGIDGWSRIINEHPQFDGLEFVYADNQIRVNGVNADCPEWIECVIYRKDRTRPIRIKEFLDEVYREAFNNRTGPWQSHTKRMHRHKALIQCARVAFGFSGIYDQDEAERIRDMGAADVVATQAPAEQLDYQELDKLIANLTERAVKFASWEAARDWVGRNQELSAGSREYVLTRLGEEQAKQENAITVDPDVPSAQTPSPEGAPVQAGQNGHELPPEVDGGDGIPYDAPPAS